jgi:tRNA(Ile)-lysidine synthase
LNVSELTQAVSESIRRHRLLLPGERILVAVSGGLDSMVLLHLLQTLSKETAWRLTVVHLNHQLRGRSSNADERLVRGTANALKLPVVIERADVRKISREQKLSLEMAGRKARHAFFARSATRFGAGVIALAHHADDQTELFFERLLRGSGGQGLAGMKWKSRSPVTARLQLARPLLNISKATLRTYAVRNKIRHREDASNACLDFLRNRVRHELLPLMKRRYQPALSDVVRRTVEILGSETELLDQLAAKWLQNLNAQAGSANSAGGKQKSAEFCESLSFQELHVALQRRVVQAQLLALGVVPDFELVEKLRTFPGVFVSVREPVTKNRSAESPVTAPSETRQVLVFRDTKGVLHLGNSNSKQGDFAVSSLLSCHLSGRAGSAVFDGTSFRWRITNGSLPARLKRLPSSELFDADKVRTPVILRHWQPGDRFQPIGLHAAVKLQDLFTNQRIPRGRRRELVLATTAAGEIFWVEGLRIAERFKLTQKTIRRLHWAWERF